jgi:iron complex outermembrane receptor protein
MSKPLSFALATLLLSPLATGTSSAQTVVTSDADIRLQEVVVTAQRRTEDAQKAAIAITTLSGDAVQSANITRPEGLTELVPALQVQDDTGPYSIFYVRGVGNFAANGLSDPALVLNFDGVTVSRSGTSGLFYDLQRVEVLKGPQGTLYGRNATGGVINVISNPAELGKFGADASVQFGNYSSNREDGMLNIPIGTISALRIAAFHTQHDGYLTDGESDQDDTGARLSFRIVPSDTLSVSIIGDYFKQGGIGSGSTITGPSGSFLPGPSFGIDNRYGVTSPEVTAYLATQPNFLNGRTFAPFDGSVLGQDNKFYGLSATVDWRTPIGTVTLIPAWRESSLDYTSFASGVMLREDSTERQTSVELRLASDKDQPLTYVAGLFYYDDPQAVPRFDVNQQSVVTFQSYSADTVSKAAFATLTYAFVPSVRLTGGLRYTKDDKDFTGNSFANQNICLGGFFACPTATPFPYTQMAAVPPVFFNPDGTITLLHETDLTGANAKSASWNKTTWRAGVDWDVSNHNLLYASVETGYKSGGFYYSADTGEFKPETITAYTLGSKNRFMDNRLQLNAEVFYWKYKDQQISHLGLDSAGNIIFPTENVGASTIKGAEVDLQARPVRYTLLTADVQYNDAVYDNFVYHTPNSNGGVGNGTGCPDGAPPGTTYTVDCSGKTPPYAPKWTATASLQQTIPLPNSATLVGEARVHYQSEMLTGLEFLPVEYQGAYSLWNFNLTYNSKDDRFYVGAYIDNAFDKTALSFSFPVPLSGFVSGTLIAPRTYGARAGIHF